MSPDGGVFCENTAPEDGAFKQKGGIKITTSLSLAFVIVNKQVVN